MNAITGELRIPATQSKGHDMTGAGELKVLHALPALMAGVAAVPGAETDAALMLRVTLLICILVGYLAMVVQIMRQRRSKKPPFADRVMAGLAQWSANAVAGGVGTYVYFHVSGAVWSVGANITATTVLSLGGVIIATKAITYFETVDAKEAARRARQVLHLPEQPDSDPPT